MMVAITSVTTRSGVRVPVYNFAVAEHHTTSPGRAAFGCIIGTAIQWFSKPLGRGSPRNGGGKTYDEAADIVLDAIVTDTYKGDVHDREGVVRCGAAAVLEGNPKFAAGNFDPVADLARIRSKVELLEPGVGTLAISKIPGESHTRVWRSPKVDFSESSSWLQSAQRMSCWIESMPDVKPKDYLLQCKRMERFTR